MARDEVAPLACIWRTTGSTFAAKASAQPSQFGVEISAPKTQMWKRVEEYAQAYADRIGTADPFWTFCNTRLKWSHANESTNGLRPFGSNYNTIRTEAELKAVIDECEAYEKSYLVLCLADVKRILTQAKAK